MIIAKFTKGGVKIGGRGLLISLIINERGVFLWKKLFQIGKKRLNF